MKARAFLDCLGADFFAGVPDSQLRALCDRLICDYGTDPHRHVIAANEGNCVAVAAGYHMATGKIPVVYMQNSGEGNIVNPVASLLNDRVYAIPMIFVIGWRGEPGVHDEPQHIYQGEVTIKLLEDLGIASYVIDASTTEKDVLEKLREWKDILDAGKQVAFVVRKGALESDCTVKYRNGYGISREEAIAHIAAAAGGDVIVSTTGKASRELFEIRERTGTSHASDFLTVGSMGHSSSIALGIALQKPNTRVWCIDGDGAMLMHMGSMAVIGAERPANLVHIVIDNGAHETVGGMPTVSEKLDLAAIARACGYPRTACADNLASLDRELQLARGAAELTFLAVKCSLGARADLGRPTTSALHNKQCFMEYLKSL